MPSAGALHTTELRDAAIKADGEYVGSVFYVDSPDPEEARAVIIAPNNMMTAKTVVSL